MRYYETLYLLSPELSEDEYKDVIKKFNGIIEKNKGVVIKVDEWGLRELAYRVRKFDKGYYILLQYCGEPGITHEVERDMRLDDRVMKYQTVKLSDKADPDALKKELGSHAESEEITDSSTGTTAAPEQTEQVKEEGAEHGVQ